MAIPRASPLLGLLDRILEASLLLFRTLSTCLLEERWLFSNWMDQNTLLPVTSDTYRNITLKLSQCLKVPSYIPRGVLRPLRPSHPNSVFKGVGAPFLGPPGAIWNPYGIIVTWSTPMARNLLLWPSPQKLLNPNLLQILNCFQASDTSGPSYQRPLKGIIFCAWTVRGRIDTPMRTLLSLIYKRSDFK